MFDPYRKWLGIPEGQRPPSYYQLLGIDPNERDSEVIEEAAMRQTAHVRTYQTGPHADDCKKVLGEIALARATLLKPEKRTAYDANLRKATAVTTAPAPAPAPARPVAPPVRAVPAASVTPAPAAVGFPSIPRQPADEGFPFIAPPTAATSSRGPRQTDWFKIWIAGGLLFILIGGVAAAALLFLFNGKDGPVANVDHGKPSQPEARPTEADVPPPTGPATHPTPPPDTRPKRDLNPPDTKKDPDPKKDPDKPKLKVDLRPVVMASDRQPVPPDDLQGMAEKKIKAAYKNDYARTQSASMRQLAWTLLQVGVETQDDPIARYVLYREARDLAQKASDPVLALQAVEEMELDFDVDGPNLKLAVFEKAAVIADPSTNRRLVDRALLAADEAAAGDEFNDAVKLLNAGKAAAVKANSQTLQKKVQDRLDEVEKQQADHQAALAAVELLKTSPDDAEAYLTTGRYLATWRNDWAQAVPLLAEGSDKELKALARKEAAKPMEVGPMAELADAWWELASKLDPGPARNAYMRHSLHWYRQALPDLAGLSLETAKKRIKDLARMFPEMPNQWDHLELGSNAIPVAAPAGSYLRIHSMHGVRTRSTYPGGVDINLTVRLEKADLMIEMGRGGKILISPSRQNKAVAVIQPGELGKGATVSPLYGQPVYFKPDEWYKVHVKVTEKGMLIEVEGTEVFRDKSKYDLSADKPVRVRGLDGWVEVKSLTVDGGK